MLEWSHIPPSVTSPWPKLPFRGWRRSGPKEGRSPRTFSCVFVLWGSASFEPAPRPSTAAGRVSGTSCCRRGELGPPEPGEHETRRDEGLKKTDRWAGSWVEEVQFKWTKQTSGNSDMFLRVNTDRTLLKGQFTQCTNFFCNMQTVLRGEVSKYLSEISTSTNVAITALKYQTVTTATCLGVLTL